MIRQERHFEYLIALAVAGQISEIELEELSCHAVRCSSCSQRMAEMESMNLQLFLTLAAQVKRSRISSPMRERFWIRATHFGAPMAVPSLRMQRSYLVQLATLLVAACLIAGMGWRHITEHPAAQTAGSTSTVKIGAAPQLATTAHPHFAASVAKLSMRKRSTRQTPSKGSILPSIAPDEESQVTTRPLFHLDPAFLPSQPGALNAEAKLSGLQHLPAEYFSLRGEPLTTSFSGATLRNSSLNGDPNHHAFHYSATLASISLQDDQAVFELKSRVRDLSFSNMLDSTRSR